MDLDIKNIKKKIEKGNTALTKTDDGFVKIVQKQFKRDGEEITPFEMITSAEHFNDLWIDNKMTLLQEEKKIAQDKINLANRERDFAERKNSLERDGADLLKEIEKISGVVSKAK